MATVLVPHKEVKCFNTRCAVKKALRQINIVSSENSKVQHFFFAILVFFHFKFVYANFVLLFNDTRFLRVEKEVIYVFLSLYRSLH